MTTPLHLRTLVIPAAMGLLLSTPACAPRASSAARTPPTLTGQPAPLTPADLWPAGKLVQGVMEGGALVDGKVISSYSGSYEVGARRIVEKTPTILLLTDLSFIDPDMSFAGKTELHYRVDRAKACLFAIGTPGKAATLDGCTRHILRAPLRAGATWRYETIMALGNPYLTIRPRVKVMARVTGEKQVQLPGESNPRRCLEVSYKKSSEDVGETRCADGSRVIATMQSKGSTLYCRGLGFISASSTEQYRAAGSGAPCITVETFERLKVSRQAPRR